MTSKQQEETIAKFRVAPELFVKYLNMRVGRNTLEFGRAMAPHQAEWLRVLSPQFLALATGDTPPKPRVWMEATKGAGKDHILSALSLWLVAFASVPVYGQVGAADREQADELSKSAKDWLFSNPWLESFVTQKLFKLSGKHAELEIIPADVAGSHGARPNLLILNEIHAIDARWEFVQNALDNAEKVPGLVCVATNAGFVDSPAWNLRQVAIQSEWEFLQYKQPAPWISDRGLADAKRRNPPSRYARLYRGEWQDGTGDAFDPMVIRRAVKPKQPINDEWKIVVGVDIGIKNDASAIVVIAKHVGLSAIETIEPPKIKHQWAFKGPEFNACFQPTEKRIIKVQGSGRLRLLDVRTWKPENCGGTVDVAEIEQELLALDKRLSLSGIALDPSQAIHLQQRLQALSLPAFLVNQSTTNLVRMAELTVGAFRDDNIDLHDEPDLISDICNLRMVEKSYGVRLESPRKKGGSETQGTAHGDTASALQLALYAANEIAPVQSSVQGRTLLCWP